MPGIAPITNIWRFFNLQANLFLKIRTVSIARWITFLTILSPAFLTGFADVTVMLTYMSVGTWVVSTFFYNLVMVAEIVEGSFLIISPISLNLRLSRSDTSIVCLSSNVRCAFFAIIVSPLVGYHPEIC